MKPQRSSVPTTPVHVAPSVRAVEMASLPTATGLFCSPAGGRAPTNSPDIECGPHWGALPGSFKHSQPRTFLAGLSSPPRPLHFSPPQSLPRTWTTQASASSRQARSSLPDMWRFRSDPVLHIELRRWADLMLVAPLDANTLGKVASGICDNLLTCVIRAWDLRKPLLFCPAMNTAMWEHPITAQQVDQLKAFGYIEIPCVVKKLVCGDQGLGAMAEVDTIVDKVKEVLSQHRSCQQS
ncbi:phosphopantothenoylcysteine decarboxylase isoform X1 [Talpa occidentalis]|uniref:phosphopantothenoylcysteine decarboxylase isoform X1 n=1 Tax=Talpa occidentalis TaxID=50954 RepID=UPI00188E871F|nr:phosphopantothenoylcysteine decarboxylase isoform X1 [Talpa occidentalis]